MYETRRVGAYKRDYASRANDDQRESIESSIIAAKDSHPVDPNHSSDVQKYDENGVKQKVFNIQVLDFTVRTGLPFSLTETDGFRKFVYDLNPKLSCPSRKTVTQNLNERYSKVIT